MRILFVASLHHPGADGEKPGSRYRSFPVSQAHHFWVKSLERMGHECAVFWRSASALRGVRPQPLRMTDRTTARRALAGLIAKFPEINPDHRLRNLHLLGEVKRFEPDVLLLIGGNRVILPATLRTIKRQRDTLLLYTCGTPPSIFSHRIEREAAELYDLVIANDRGHAREWHSLGASRAMALPMSAVDPEFHRRYVLSAEQAEQYRSQIGFIGTLIPHRLYSKRVAALESLKDYDLAIWSVHEVPETLQAVCRGPALGEAMVHALNGADIAVNPHGDFMSDGGNMRLFEACGVGALQVVNECPGIHLWFKAGEHLLTYRDVDELRNIVGYYLKNPMERERIAAAGREHVYTHHTYDHRMRNLLGIIHGLR